MHARDINDRCASRNNTVTNSRRSVVFCVRLRSAQWIRPAAETQRVVCSGPVFTRDTRLGHR